MTDYNSNQAININPNAFFFSKKSLYQNCYSNKAFLLKGSQNFLSQKNMLNQSNKNNRNMQRRLCGIHRQQRERPDHCYGFPVGKQH
jgi:hypothetical protein